MMLGRLQGALCLLLLVASAPVAGADPKLEGKVRSLLDTAIAEHTVFLNCLATVPGSAAPVTDNWRRDITEAANILGQLGFPLSEIAAFERRAAPEQLLRREASFSEVLELCTADPEWDKRLYGLDFVLLSIELGELLPGGDGSDGN